ncbi:MAG: bifunctional diguanylate cyclase/phosphodiesterase [Geminicoccaceae bacterium]
MRFAINDKILLPVFAFVGCSMAMLAGFVWYSAVQQDEIAAEHSIDAAQAIIDEELERIGMVAKEFSWQNDAVRHLDIAFSDNWAASNFGYYVHDKYDYDISMVVDREGETIYNQIGGRPSTRQAEDMLEGGLGWMIDEARRAPWREPEAITGLLTKDQSIVMVAVCAVSLEPNANIKMAKGDRVVVILAKRLTPSVISSLMDSPHLQGISLAGNVQAPTPAESAALSLIAPDEEPIGRLTWNPFQPGRKFLESVAPALGVGIAAILAFTWLLIWRVRSSTREIKRSETRFRDVAGASSDWIWETDAKGQLKFLSEQFALSTGTSTDKVIDKPIGELLRPIGGINKIKKFRRDLKGQEHFRDFLCRYVDGKGQRKTLRVAGKPFFSGKGKFQGFRGTATDITAEIEAKHRIQHLALHDSLTDLPNRAQLRQRVAAAVESVGHGAGKAAVLCIDLDRFKEINDTLGHSAGDLLIKGCAERLRAAVRETDTIARIGGDEFAIVQTAIDQPEGAHRLCQRLLKSITRPYDLDGHEVLVTASIGVAVANSSRATPERLLQKADIALYRAKEDGRNAYRFYEPGMDAYLHQRKKIERGLRAALVRNELELFYQPKLDLKGGRIFGAEALLRWRQPDQQIILPDAFIGIAEETGLILGLGEWVMIAACKQAACWPGLTVSLNVSPVQFKHHNIVSMVERCLAETGVQAERIELEITEGVLMRNTEAAVSTLKDLQALGVRIVMDDFGTHYSGLSYLLSFPFDKIKIDQSFVRSVRRRPGADAIVRAVVELGHSLDMSICAEGVETSEQLAFLKSEGCDEVQGYLVGEPMTVDQFEQSFAEFNARPNAIRRWAMHDDQLEPAIANESSDVIAFR